MYCMYHHMEMNCSGTCLTCGVSVNFNKINETYFNYKCPDCKGEFNTPSTPGITSSLYYKCPFCGRIMEGL